MLTVGITWVGWLVGCWIVNWLLGWLVGCWIVDWLVGWLVRAVKSMPRALRHFEVDPVLKIDAIFLFHSRQNLCRWLVGCMASWLVGLLVVWLSSLWLWLWYDSIGLVLFDLIRFDMIWLDDWLVDCLDVWREGGGGGGVETWSSRCKGTFKLKFKPCGIIKLLFITIIFWFQEMYKTQIDQLLGKSSNWSSHL